MSVNEILEVLRQAKKDKENSFSLNYINHDVDEQASVQSYDSIKKLVRPFFNGNLEIRAKIELLGHLAFWDGQESKTNRWQRQSKFHRRRFLAARNNRASQGNNVESNLLFASVILDMVNVKLKLFEANGNNVDEKLVQKMTYYNTQGIEVLEQMIKPKDDIDKQIQATFLLAQLHTKFFSSDKEVQRQHTKKAILAYDEVYSKGSKCKVSQIFIHSSSFLIVMLQE